MVLFTVLLLCVLLATIVIVLLMSVRQNRNRARSFLSAARAEMLVDVATQEVLAKIMDGGEIPYSKGKATASMTASPGMMEVRKYDLMPNRGYQRNAEAFTDENSFCRNPFAQAYERSKAGDWQPANPQLINLFSRRWYAPSIRYMTAIRGTPTDGNPEYNPARSFNINTSENPFFPGELYLSGSPGVSVAVKDGFGDPRRSTKDQFRFFWGEAAVDRPVWVQWLPVYEFVDKPPVFTDSAGNTIRNPVVGRYAYFVDVENTKVNLKTSDRLYEESDWNALLGQSDSDNVKVTNPNWARLFYQEKSNPAYISAGVKKRWDLEKSMISARRSADLIPETVEGVVGSNGDNLAANTYFRTWFDWRPEQSRPDGSKIDGRPYAADTSMVDWKTFTGVRPLANGVGDEVTIEGLLNQTAQAPGGARFNTAMEAYSLLDPKAEQADGLKGLTALAAMRRTYGNSSTIYGWEDERDPLGLPKIDIVAFQREYRERGPGGPIWNDLFARCTDPDYYKAYFPGNYPQFIIPNRRRMLSLAEGLNVTCGNNRPDVDSNGREALFQMLVNLGEYAKPKDDHPFLDENRGIMGARSIPYVTEVATRARNGLWDVADTTGDGVFTALSNLILAVEAADPGPSEALDNLLNWTYKGKRLEYFLKSSVIDMAFGMINPNPYAGETSESGDAANHRFTGELVLDLEWRGGFPAAEYPETANSRQQPRAGIDGLYVGRPVPMYQWYYDRDKSYFNSPARIRASGIAPRIRLGMVPGQAVEHPDYVTALRIKGWEIKNTAGKTYHKVPLRHPNTTGKIRNWWEMAQEGYNVGTPATRSFHSDLDRENYMDAHHHSLYPYLRSDEHLKGDSRFTRILPATAAGGGISYLRERRNIAVGWFTSRELAHYCRETTGASTNALEDISFNTNCVSGLLYLHPTEWNEIKDDLEETNETLRVEAITRLKSFMHEVVHREALVERVVSVDPVMGHRTGNDEALAPASSLRYRNPTVIRPSGHFYGANGHTWRRYNQERAAIVRHTQRRPIYGPWPPRTTETFMVDVPYGNTIIKEPRTVTIQPPRERIGWSTNYYYSVKNTSPDPSLTESFDSSITRLVEQTEIGTAIHDASLAHSISTFRRPGMICEFGSNSHVWSHPNHRRHWTGGNASFFSHAPRGDYMTSIGEIGFVHSGMPRRPIDLTQGKYSWGEWGNGLSHKLESSPFHLNTPQNGPGMHMLLDIFTPGAFRENATHRVHTRSEWESSGGSTDSNSPKNPRQGVWNMNSVVAHDEYLGVREGGLTSLRVADAYDQPIHPYWVPSAQSARRLKEPTKDFKWGWHWKMPLDPNMSPSPRYRRGWESWISIIGGDFTPTRSRGSGPWEMYFNWDPQSYYQLLPASNFSWHPGPGATNKDSNEWELYNQLFVTFDPENPGQSQLLVKGTPRWLDRQPNGPLPRYSRGWPEFPIEWYRNIVGRPSADANYGRSEPLHVNPSNHDMYDSSRFDVFPMRQHISEIINTGNISVNGIATSLNPKYMTATVSRAAKRSLWQRFQQGYAGRWRETGVFANAPLSLISNQISTSANVFTIHVVTQSLQDNGLPRSDKGTPAVNVNTGTGFMDASDEVLAEHWARVVVAKTPVMNAGGNVATDPETGGPAHDYKVLYSAVREFAR